MCIPSSWGAKYLEKHCTNVMGLNSKKPKRVTKQINIETIIRILRWVEDMAGGEMIESPRHGYTREYLIEDVTFDQSETICGLLNPLLIALNINAILDFEDGKFINRLGKNR